MYVILGLVVSSIYMYKNDVGVMCPTSFLYIYTTVVVCRERPREPRKVCVCVCVSVSLSLPPPLSYLYSHTMRKTGGSPRRQYHNALPVK